MILERNMVSFDGRIAFFKKKFYFIFLVIMLIA